MSYGDENTYSIPTVYKGIQMRSKLETKVALFLDSLKIKWEYEPKVFLLSNGIYYKPDFYLPEHKQWIEVKGLIGDNNHEISKVFVEDTQKDLILISSVDVWFYEPFGNGNTEAFKQDGLQIGLCSNCHSYFFTGRYGIYTCRKCMTHEGDHDIRAFVNDLNWNDTIDFSCIDSIKDWLKRHQVKIK